MAQKLGTVRHLHEHKARRPSRVESDEKKSTSFLGSTWRGTFRKAMTLRKEPWPLLGAGIAGSAGLVIASALGPAELAVGAAAAYAAFRVLRNGSSSKKRGRESTKPGQGVVSESLD